ncbi:MAG: hypothetical protein AAFO07_12560 [Bacteroidota bacterium]
MKYFLLITTLFSFCFLDETGNELSNTFEFTEIPFTGTWTRTFEIAPRIKNTAEYTINEESIRYTLDGMISDTDYTILKDVYQAEDKRFIGHTKSEQYYLIFFKEVTDNSITIYKQKVANVEEGMKVAIPAADTKANYGWNTYEKK